MASVKSREEQDDDPPMSRLFIICNKTNTEEEFRETFSKFGTIEEIWIVKDKLSGEHKGQWRAIDGHLSVTAAKEFIRKGPPNPSCTIWFPFQGWPTLSSARRRRQRGRSKK